MSAIAGKNGGRCLNKNLDVQPNRPAAGIFKIQANHIIKARPATPLNLPQASNSRLDFQHATTMPQIIGPKFISDGRPGANQRHLSAQNVQELRQFIQASPANKPSHGGDAWIFLDFEDRFRAVLGRFANLSGYELMDVFLMDFS